jgi:hypothetical protein
MTMLFRPEAKRKKVMADLYKVTLPDDPILENGSGLCKGKSVAYLIVWKSEKVSSEPDPTYFWQFFPGGKSVPAHPMTAGGTSMTAPRTNYLSSTLVASRGGFCYGWL